MYSVSRVRISQFHILLLSRVLCFVSFRFLFFFLIISPAIVSRFAFARLLRQILIRSLCLICKNIQARL